MNNAQKAQRLEEMATWADKDALRWKDRAVNCGSHPRESEGCMALSEAESADAALLREAAEMMRERGGISWTSEGHGMVLTSAIYRNRLMAIVGRSGRTFFWTVSKVAAREHEEFGTADTLEAAQAAAVAWLDEQEGK